MLLLYDEDQSMCMMLWVAIGYNRVPSYGLENKSNVALDIGLDVR